MSSDRDLMVPTTPHVVAVGNLDSTSDRGWNGHNCSNGAYMSYRCMAIVSRLFAGPHTLPWFTQS